METQYGTIYLIEIKGTNKRLIGQTRNKLNVRMRQYKSGLRNCHVRNYKLVHAFQKFGWAAFNFSVIERCPIECLNEREKYYIEKYDSFGTGYGLNLTSGGEAGKILSIESRWKISQKHKGRQISKEWRSALKLPVAGENLHLA